MHYYHIRALGYVVPYTRYSSQIYGPCKLVLDSSSTSDNALYITFRRKNPWSPSEVLPRTPYKHRMLSETGGLESTGDERHR